MLMTSVAYCCLMLMIVGCGRSAAANPVGPAIGGFGVVPLSGTGAPLGASYFTVELRRGTTWTGRVLVRNYNGHAEQLYVNALAALTAPTTGEVYTNRLSVTRGTAAAWVHPANSHVTIAAHSSVVVPFSVQVPLSAEAGDHLAGLGFQPVRTSVSPGRFHVHLILRSVLGVLIIVRGPAVARVLPGRVSLEQAGLYGAAEAAVGVRNVGSLLAKPYMHLIITGPRGFRHSVARQLGTVLPGSSVNYPVVLGGRLLPGKYGMVSCLSIDRGSRPKCSTSTEVLGHGVGRVAVRAANGVARSRRSLGLSATYIWLLASAGGVVATGGALLFWRERRIRRALQAQLREPVSDLRGRHMRGR